MCQLVAEDAERERIEQLAQRVAALANPVQRLAVKMTETGEAPRRGPTRAAAGTTVRLGIADLTSRLGVSELVQRGWTRVFDRREAAAEVVLRFMA